MPRTTRRRAKTPASSPNPPKPELEPEKAATPKTRSPRRRRPRKPSPGTFGFKVSYGGGDSVILYRKIEHRGTSRYVMRPLFD